MAPLPKKAAQAKCEANQAALDRLAEKRASLGPNDRYSFTLKRAMESLAECTDPVTTTQQALALKYVGSHIATIICPPDKERLEKRKRSNKQQLVSQNNSATSSPADSVKSNGSSTASTKVKRPRKTTTATAAQLATILEKPTGKEVAYRKAVQAAETWKSLTVPSSGGPLTWRVVLLIDTREVNSEHVQAKCQMSGIPCEERQLPIGDMAWMAQGLQHRGKKVVVELMLGTIIERKTPEDLKSSLFGTRYWEQRLRLQHSGLPQVLFLIEGDLTKELFHCSADTLHTAVWETRMHLNFSIVHTAHMDDTVMTLKRMHRRILQRTFPRAFETQEALPTFQEAYASSNQQRRLSLEEQGRRRRRRQQSLAEMTFDMDPIPPLGMERFISYAELKAKIERDREAGTKTVGSLHLAMLKQVASFSTKKCQAVATVYPTVNHLMQAYSTTTTNTNNKQTLVTEFPTHEPGKSATNRTIGPRSSAELYIAYGMDEEAAASGDDAAAIANSTNVVVAATKPAVATAPNDRASAGTTASVAAKQSSRDWEEESRAVTRPLFAAKPSASTKLLLDRKLAARKPAGSIDLSMDSSDDEDDVPHTTANCKPPVPSRPKTALNTSIGSLLNSSDDDPSSPFLPRQDSFKRNVASQKRDSPGEKYPPNAVLRTIAIASTNMDSSSSSSDDETGLTLFERMQARKLQAPCGTTATSSTSIAKLNDIIEID